MFLLRQNLPRPIQYVTDNGGNQATKRRRKCKEAAWGKIRRM